MNNRHSMLHSTLLLTLASMVLRGVSIFFQVFLSGTIGAAGVGLLQLISTVSFFAMTLGTSGIRIGAMYLSAEEYGMKRPGGIQKAVQCCMRYGFTLSVIAGGALVILAEPIAERWLRDIQAAAALRVVGLFLPISCLWSVMDGYFTACSKIKQLVMVEFIDRGISIAATLFLLLYWAGGSVARSCTSVVLGNSIGTCIGFLILFSIYCRNRRAMGRDLPKPPMWRRLFKLCIPLALNDYLRSGLSTLEQFLIPRGLAKSGASYESSMASYGTIQGMVFPILMFPSVLLYSLSDLLVPELASCRAEHNTRRVYFLTNRCLKMGFLFACSIAGLMFCLSTPLGRLFYQSELAGRYLKIFAPLVLILYMDAMVDGMHKGLGQQAYCVRYNTITSFLDVVFLFALLPRFGIAGYFLTFTVSHAVNFFLSIRRLLKVTGYSIHISFPIKTGLCAIVSCFLSHWMLRFIASDLSAVLLIPVVFLLCFTLLLLLGCVLDEEDLQWLKQALIRKKPPVDAPAVKRYTKKTRTGPS